MPKNGKWAIVLELLGLERNFLCLIYSPQLFLSKKTSQKIKRDKVTRTLESKNMEQKSIRLQE